MTVLTSPIVPQTRSFEGALLPQQNVSIFHPHCVVEIL